MDRPEVLTYYRVRCPEEEVPAGEPEWFLYEISRARDAVLRSVELYPDGHITRDTIELEQRHGNGCPSLVDCSLDVAFADAPLVAIAREAFEAAWARGIDVPFWFPDR